MLITYPGPGSSCVISVQAASKPNGNTYSQEHAALPQTALTHTVVKPSAAIMLLVNTNEYPKGPGEGCSVA